MENTADTLNRLLELTKLLANVDTLDEALKAVTDAALDLLPSNHTSLRIFDDSRKLLLCGARSGDGTENLPMSFREGEGILGWVARYGEAAIVHDTMNDSRFVEGSSQGFPVRSLLAVPLLSSGRVIGVLGATSPEVRAYSPQDEQLATLLANCAIPAIDRVRLERLSLCDSETVAFHAGYLVPRLEEEIGRSRRHAVPLSVLRLHVHDIVDETRTIRFLADTIRLTLRSTDVLFRTGETEFTVILSHTTGDHASAVAGRLESTLEVTALSDELRLWPACISVVTWDGKETAEAYEKRSMARLEEVHQGRQAKE